jgi:hypothetical protein
MERFQWSLDGTAACISKYLCIQWELIPKVLDDWVGRHENGNLVSVDEQSRYNKGPREVTQECRRIRGYGNLRSWRRQDGELLSTNRRFYEFERCKLEPAA